MSLRVAVTGARGFIGRHVVTALEARGDAVAPIARPFDRATLAQAFRGTEVVVHLAGVVSAVREAVFVSANVDATRAVASAARDAGTRLVHISSLAAAGPAPPSAPRSEDDAPSPITAYGRTKLEGERVIQGMTDLRWTILRPGVVYGPGDRAVTPLFRYGRLRLLPLVGRPSAAFIFIYIDDLVRAILAAIDRQRHGETIFLGHAKPVTPRELLEQVRVTLGGSALIVRPPRAIVWAVALCGDAIGSLTGNPAPINSNRYAEIFSPGFVCRVDRMRERLGVVADTTLEQGFALSREWYLQQID